MTTPRTSLEVTLSTLTLLIDEVESACARFQDGEEAAVHDLRTAIRRLRSLLSSVGAVLNTNDLKPILNGLREVGEWLEPARTAQVRREIAQKLLYDEDRADYPDELRERLVREAIRDETAARESVLENLRSDSFQALRRRLGELVKQPPLGKHFADDPKARIQKIVAKQAKRSTRKLRAMDTDDLGSLHSARKAARRFRYVADAFSGDDNSLLSDVWAHASGRATKFQDAIGDHRDTTIFLDVLADEATAAARAGEDPSFYLELEQSEREQQHHQLRMVRKQAAKYRTALAEVA